MWAHHCGWCECATKTLQAMDMHAPVDTHLGASLLVQQLF